MVSGVIITGSVEEGHLFIESVSYPDGRTYPVFFSKHFGWKWFQGADRDCYAVYIGDDDKEVYLYKYKGLWLADDDPQVKYD